MHNPGYNVFKKICLKLYLFYDGSFENKLFEWICDISVVFPIMKAKIHFERVLNYVSKLNVLMTVTVTACLLSS